jgi:ankyrin repeat protein
MEVKVIVFPHSSFFFSFVLPKIGPGSFFPDPVSPTDQVRTWVTYFDENDADKFHWSILPLHLAIILDAPFTTIRRLVELYPDSVKCTDDQNMLPLHIAMRHGSSNRVVDFLFCAFPEALNAKGKNDLTPLDCAIQGKDVVRARILNTFISIRRENCVPEGKNPIQGGSTR